MAANLEQLTETLISIRRNLHEHPELSYEEFETTKAIKNWLEEKNITIIHSNLETGVIAEISGNRNGPLIAIRADIDALPIQEETNLPYASKIHGKMHACGHDFHTAAIIGAAYLLKEKESSLSGTVRFIFQPAEESSNGACKVIEAGHLHGVQAIFGMHNKPDLPVGTIGIKDGPLMAGVDRFEIEIHGVGTHAAVPDAGVDPIVASSQIVMALQTIVSRNINSSHNAVVSVTNIHSGNTWNVIPEKATLEGTVRTFQTETREKIPALMKRIIQGVSDALGVKTEFRFYAGPPAVHNDTSLTNLSTQVAETMNLNIISPTPSMAGEDFSFYQQEIPGSFVFMGTSGTHEWHHPSFTVDERALPISAEYFALLAEKALKHFS
ncbi:M20 peptidase aminoacylase family protein [Bacillus cereus group sp. MYBK71-2]|uniref:M20 peptidase aminoacylase family protein n=1 Tax=Bacillus cereus group TaxID=86661 RepID=UPI000CD94754|nr:MULTISPECIES: M20 peptidase aminoacylase family protein [Bacillus cereus group]MCC2337150.1 M20 peptidase aminoacylase family protein [Bacillus tropicus]MCU5423013.1 M20 peptidase aminoacylase family protein [Bacillus tropicus]MDA1652825.1 M20 peptidase aminoacylase family protein [Bacillus cereus group sp. TH160LC]MDA1778470.1 M20 peptidase aminoacylase family protein [Bacillus cereus group sp. BY9-3LC]MDA1798273.1 M20 peptidase aminoacylase family protein [Bacillus cereus group sp. BY6-1L